MVEAATHHDKDKVADQPKYSTPERRYEARRAGLLPPNAAEDKAVLDARAEKAKAEAEAKKKATSK